MNYDLLIESSVRAILMTGGMLIFLMVAMIFSVKLKAKGSWLVEFNNNGTLSYAMVRPNQQGSIELKHGEYFIPNEPRMRVGWPFGVPVLFQEMVWHEKFTMGNPEPIEYDVMESTGLSMMIKHQRAAEERAIQQVQEGLAAYTGVKNPIQALMLLGVLTAAGLAAAGAYFGYTNFTEMQELAVLLKNI